jgi:starvation-inducible outer membrane lipoprotein
MKKIAILMVAMAFSEGRTMRMLTYLGVAALFLVVSCAPQAPPVFPPQELRGAKTFPDLSMVRQNPESYRSETVLLGGQVLAVQTPKPGIRQIEVCQSPLDSQGMPTLQPGSGRFLVIIEEAQGVPEIHVGCRLAVL